MKNHGGKIIGAGRKPKQYETERLTFQVPKEIKSELYKKLKPIVEEAKIKFIKDNPK